MKIAIIADTHDNLVNIKKIVSWLNQEKISLILHCGDVATLEALETGFSDFKGDIHVSLGNADIRHNLESAQRRNYHIVSGFGEINSDNKKIAFTHFPEEAKKLAGSGKYHLVFYGHTHKPWEEKVGECRLVNPGEAAGQYQIATFAVYDTMSGKLELKILGKIG